MSKAKSKTSKAGKRMTPDQQLEAFKAMADEVGADAKPGALDRSFGRIDPKAKKPAKAK